MSFSRLISAVPVNWSKPLASKTLTISKSRLKNPPYKNSYAALALLRGVSQGRPVPPLSDFSDAQINWIITTGFAPLACFLSRAESHGVESPLGRELESVDLSVRFINNLQLETLRELLKRSQGLLPPITLLKGCSIATEYYPEAHLRLMRDLDVLVNPKDQPLIEALLREMGFRQQSENNAAYYLMHHHSMPFFHPATGVWVEVHRDLFPTREEVGRLPVFSRKTIKTESMLSSFEDMSVIRLSPELQMVYTASHWALCLIGLVHRGGLFALLDLLLILRKLQHRIRWNVILKWINNSVAATHLYLLLSYLRATEIFDVGTEVLRELFRCQKSFGTLNLKIAHKLITRQLVAGKSAIAPGKLAICWKNLLLNDTPMHNLGSFCTDLFSLCGQPVRGSGNAE